jgi:hypothetical protein
MALSSDELEKIVTKNFPGFTIVTAPASDAPDFFAPSEASALDFEEVQKRLGEAKPQAEASTDDVTTLTLRSPDNPTNPTAGSQLKYVFISKNTGEILAVQG